MTWEQIVAMAIFLIMFIAIMSGKVHRFIPALIGAGFTIILILVVADLGPHSLWQVLRLDDFIDPHWWYNMPKAAEETNGVLEEVGGVNWQTIVFIGGMMTMVEGLGAVGFFRWICFVLAKLVHYQVVPILVVFMLLSGFLSMFIDSITVLLFLSIVTIELARLLKFDPVPMIIAEIFAANAGGSATMSGDPPNIIIGTALHYTFADFAENTAPIAWVGMLITLVVFYFLFRKALSTPYDHGEGVAPAERYPEPSEAIINPPLFKVNTGIFILVVLLIVTHANTGLSVALIGCIAAALTLLAARSQALHVLKGVDWRTLLFFLGLFITVGGLEATGMLEKLANAIGNASGGDILIAIPFILWISAFASSVVDNIPFAATMVPVIQGLAFTEGFNLHTLAWTLALGTDIGGNGTPIGASANVVGTAIAEREGYPISWGRFCKYAFPAMLLVVALCHAYLALRYG